MTLMNKPRHLFPAVLAKPVSLIPGRWHAMVISRALNHLFAEQIADGELDFLKGRTLQVEVTDTGIRFMLSFDGKYLSGTTTSRTADLIFRGNLHDFLLVATRREDSDTLFFQRRLKIEGDTEMGLAIKNFLDGIEIESLPCHRQMDGFLNRGLRFYEQLT